MRRAMIGWVVAALASAAVGCGDAGGDVASGSLPGTVTWQTVSPIDGHTLHGEFQFGVGAAVGQQDAPSPDPTPGDLLVAVSVSWST
jgi:hypothetical protein